jgi:hypothetical protein
MIWVVLVDTPATISQPLSPILILISHLINTGIRYATAPASALPENNPFNAVVLPTDIDPNNAIIMHKVKVELTGVFVVSFTWLNNFEKGKAPSRAYAKVHPTARDGHHEEETKI